jgi:hypothetical protein
VRNLYDHHFNLKPGTRVYIPTAEGRARGVSIKENVQATWRPPAGYFHLLAGGHVAAVQEHRDAGWLASLDLQRFFDQITRAKVHRALKAIGLSHTDAWEAACDSTVDKRPPDRQFSVPFGFVQSPILASIVLAQSALGGAIRKVQSNGLTVTVYVDDITISGSSEPEIQDAITVLENAAGLSGFSFNEGKTQPPARSVVCFNIRFGSGEMEIVEDRLAEFESVLRNGSEYEIGGILSYVDAVSKAQGAKLAESLEGKKIASPSNAA